MQATTAPTPWRQLALCAATSFWLAGHWFFPEGYTHIKAFWCYVTPLVLFNADALPRPRRPTTWLILLFLLLLWQVAVSSRHPGAWCRPGGLTDALAVIVFVGALQIMAATRGAWSALRWTLFTAAATTMAWSLVSFYPLSGVALAGDRLRNVLIYDDGLSPVLTGLLAGFAMLAGMTLDTVGGSRARRAVLWTGIATLAFAMMATQTRGAMLAAAAATATLLWRERQRTIPAIAAAATGILTFLAAFPFGSGTEPLPDLVSRGTSGRPSIWSVYLDRFTSADWWVGKGRVEALPDSVLGWHAHHPHSSLLTQLVHSGIPGVLLLAALLAWSLRAATSHREPGSATLALLVFGLTGLFFDGAHIISLFSVPRIESLLVLVPAVFAVHAIESRRHGPAAACPD